MSAAPRRSSAAKSVARSEVSKALEDRIPADGEQVGHILDPERTEETVRYPDPQAPEQVRDNGTTAPQSNANIQMGRRTDAGPALPADSGALATKSSALLWVAIAVGLFLAIALLVALA